MDDEKSDESLEERLKFRRVIEAVASDWTNPTAEW